MTAFPLFLAVQTVGFSIGLTRVGPTAPVPSRVSPASSTTRRLPVRAAAPTPSVDLSWPEFDEEEMSATVSPALVWLFAGLPPILGYFFYDDITLVVRDMIDLYSGGAGRMVDGNAFAINLLRPTVNGVVVPTLSIALGTLLATTINVLRDRQVDIRTCLNTEVGLIRLLRRALFGAFGTAQHSTRRRQALALLNEYTTQLLEESHSGAIALVQDTSNQESNALDRLATMLHGVDGAAASREFSISHAASLIGDLNAQRSKRVALLLGSFPTIHWVILGLLSISIVVVFLIETNQEVLQYLNSLQLRSAFVVLVAVCSGTSILCYDLNEPFSGSFSIRSAVEQLQTLQLLLERDMIEADLPPQFNERKYWGAKETVYFHLLTGKVADQVRFLGDILVWSRDRVLHPFRRRSSAATHRRASGLKSRLGAVPGGLPPHRRREKQIIDVSAQEKLGGED